MATPTINVAGMNMKVTRLLSNKVQHTSVKDFVDNVFKGKEGVNEYEFKNIIKGAVTSNAQGYVDDYIGSMFRNLDNNNNGTIERNEFNGFCRTLGFDVEESIKNELTVGDLL